MGALVPCVHFCRYGKFTACVHGTPSGTLRVPPPPPRQGRLEIRSVPLRGYDFEIASHRSTRSRCMGFRPLTGFLLLSFPRRYGGSGEQCEPMGALVPCVHFCRYGWFTACVHGAPSGTLRVPPPPLWQGRLEIRSGPLRGYGFEIKQERVSLTRSRFPSPYGDMVLK